MTLSTVIEDLVKRIHDLEKELAELQEQFELEDDIGCPLCYGALSGARNGKRWCKQENGLCGHFYIFAKPKRGRAHYQASARFYKTTAHEETGAVVDHPQYTKRKRELIIQFTPGDPPLVLSRDHEWLEEPLKVIT